MKKRLLATILALTMVLCLCPVTARAATDVPEGFIPVSTPEELYAIRYDMDGKYFLTNDIDLTEALSKDGSLYDPNGWIAFGQDPLDSSKYFDGVLDGNGHTIYGYWGEYGLIDHNDGIIKNLTMAGSVNYDSFSCTLVYMNDDGNIYNCHNQMDITTQNTDIVGGLVYWNLGVMLFCSNTGNISVSNNTGSLYVSGVAGRNNGTMLSCWNHGTIFGKTAKGKVYAGGVVGHLWSGAVSDCYNAGTIKAVGTDTQTGAGGIIGQVTEDARLKQITNCYNVGQITSSHKLGAIAGHVVGDVTFKNCLYSNSSCSHAAMNGAYSGITGYSMVSMKQQRAYTGFDFERVWGMGSGDYPYAVLTGECPHVLKHQPGKEAGCKKDGKVECWYCEVCNKYYTDEQGSKEISVDDIVIPAGHKFTEYISNNDATCTVDGTKTAKCEKCGVEETVEDEGGMLPHNYQDGACTVCGAEEPKLHRGDIDRDGDVDVDDVLALLWYVLFPNDYPID